MAPSRKIQLVITSSVLVVLVARQVFPDLKIDGITTILITIAIVPWLAPLFKTVELPGGFKFEFQDLERVKEEAKSVGLISEGPLKDNFQYNFLSVADSDPALALAGLRMELEKSLKTLAEKNKIKFARSSISFLMLELHRKGLISDQERSVLADMIGTLNTAVHGGDLDGRTTSWIIDVGPKILESIKRKME